jgi:uncharacterized GH25 family protein
MFRFVFRFLLALVAVLGALTTAHAHFVFIVPDVKNPAKVLVVFSDDLDVDDNIPASRLRGLKLTGRFEGGKEAPVECKEGKSCLKGELGLVNPQCVFGTHTLGVMQKGEGKPYLLTYHPKAVFAGADPKHMTLGEKVAPVELVPFVAGSEVKFQFLAAGKPVAEVEVTVIKPDGAKEKLKTDKDGFTSAVPAKGQYGAWARHFESKSGEHNGKAYEEIRHYATLVVDLEGKSK